MATSRKPSSRSKKKTQKSKDVTDAEIVSEDTASAEQADSSGPLILEADDAAPQPAEDSKTSEKAADPEPIAPDENTGDAFDPTLVDESEPPSTSATAETDTSDDAVVTAESAPAEPARAPIFLPMLLGGVLAAGLGFALSQYLQPTNLQTELESLQGDLAAQGAQIAELQGSLQERDATISELQSNQLSFDTQIAELSALIEAAPQGDPSLLSDELRATLDAQKSEIERLQGSLEEMATFASEQIASAEEELADAAAAEARVKARGAMNEVRNALASGQPFSDALPDIAGAAEVPAELSSVAEIGVSSLVSLQSGFSDAARSALPVSLREIAGDSTQDRLRLFLQDQLGARSLSPREGDDPDAVLSRADAAVRSGDLNQAIDMLNQLPQSGQDAMSDWISKAQERVSAEQAFASLENALGEN